MVTLRAFNTPAEAALAKSLLDDHGIVCSLADENSWLYGGAPIAMPVRLLVAEDQAEEASRILKDPPDGTNAVLDPAEEAAAISAGDAAEAELGERPNNPWEFLALALLVAIPGVVLLLQKQKLIMAVPWRDRWLATVMPVNTVHVLGVLVLAAAAFLVGLFFYVRREINREREPSLPISKS